MVARGVATLLVAGLLGGMPTAQAAMTPLPLRTVSVDGDRYADVVLGDYEHERVLVYLGGPTGLERVPITAGRRRAQMGDDAGPIGDFDGDGLADIYATAPGIHGRHTTTVYVIRGARPFTHVNLAHPGRRVIRIRNVPRSVADGTVTAGGDVNGDGLDDLLIGTNHRLDVVFGSRSRHSVNLNALGHRGWTLHDPGRVHYFDSTTTAVGDLNGDGHADIGIENTILLGGRRPPLSRRRHIKILGTSDDYVSELGPAGDLDGDGFADLLISDTAPQETWVVRGGRSFGRSPIRVWRLGGLDASGYSPTGVGDFTGDGRPDVLITNDQAAPVVTVQFVGAHPFRRGRHRLRGLRIDVVDNGFFPSTWAGDVNGDGRADVVVGVTKRCLVYGGPATGKISIRHLGSRGVCLH